jgi:hypothetical protein
MPNRFFKIHSCIHGIKAVCYGVMTQSSAFHIAGAAWSWWWRSAIAQGKGTA